MSIVRRLFVLGVRLRTAFEGRPEAGELTLEALDVQAQRDDDLIQLGDRAFEVRVPDFEVGESRVHGRSILLPAARGREEPGSA